MFDFDRVIERRGSHSSKWDNIAKLSGITSPDAIPHVIPMWVADMDFAAPHGVTAALTAELERGVYGYYADTGTWAEALAGWVARRHALTIDPAWVCPMPGIVSGLALLVQALSEPGDEVIIFPPVYHAFSRVILANERRVLNAGLVEANGRYTMDLEALAAKLTPRSKFLIICNPQNPGGTVWSPEELKAVGDFCIAHDLNLVSDEIHADLVLPGVARYTPTIVAAPDAASRLVTCVAATKTFNLAGAHVGALYTSSPDLRARIDARIKASALTSFPSLSMVATEAAWRTGDDWLDALLPYLGRNRDLLHAGIEAAAPGARAMKLDATYLSWIDFAGTGLSPTEVNRRVKQVARIFPSPGEQFGPGGETRLRFNFATPRSILEEAIGRLHDAFRDLRTGR